MKKHSSVILLFSLLLFAFANTGILSVQKTALSSSITTASNDCFNPNVNRPGIEIEPYNISGHIGSRVQQLFKKVHFFSPGHSNSPVTSSIFISSAAFPGLTALENNYLSHNYPSHNFW